MDAARSRTVGVVPPGGGESVPIPGFGAVFKIHSRDNGGEVAIVEHPLAVGWISPPHRHSREDEHSIVLDGEIGFRSDDDEVVLGAGGYITKPRGQMHAMWNAGSRPGRIIEVITPGGFEDYFRELGELLAAEPRKHPDRSAELARLAAKYGLSYGEPAWFGDVVARYGLTPPSRSGGPDTSAAR
jgi:quercetin dioxygenase-like cupin family protein